MMITWSRPEGKQEGEGIFQQEEAWMTIELEDTIVHPFILGQFLHNTECRRIIQDGRSKKFHFVSSVTLTSGSSSLKLLSTREKFPAAKPTIIIYVFFGLTSRPIRLSSVMLLCTSLRTVSGESPIASSSRYQIFSSDSTPMAI